MEDRQMAMLSPGYMCLSADTPSSRTVSSDSICLNGHGNTYAPAVTQPEAPAIDPALLSMRQLEKTTDCGENKNDEQPKRRGRKGHSKSRRGCHNCKRARIKCKENHPTCDYCSHRQLRCEWPDLQISQHVNQSQCGSVIRRPPQVPQPQLYEFNSLVERSLDESIPVFTMQDFRLFNHFVNSAYPHHPVGNESIWTHEIPSLASDYDFLLHAMLALAASDLADTHPAERLQLNQTALTYRVKAISSLNTAISQPVTTVEKANAMIGTCFSLFFQAVLLEDGLIEYMTFIRGVIAVSIHMNLNHVRFIFQDMFNQQEIIQSSLTDVELIHPGLARGACRSLERFCHLVVNPKEVEYFSHLLSAARNLLTSSRDAYGHLSQIYGLFSYFMSHEEFALFIDPSNEAGKLLMAHFGALQLIMTPITLDQESRKKAEVRKSGTTAGAGSSARWLRHSHSKIVEGMEEYYGWTLSIEKEVSDGTVPMRFETGGSSRYLGYFDGTS